MVRYINLSPLVLNIQKSEIGNYYFTSDFHLNHKNILYYTDRNKYLSHRDNIDDSIKEMNNIIINNMNEIADSNPNAILINCGDIILGNHEEFWDYQSKLRFSKIINITGNHDLSNIFRDCTLEYSYDKNAKIQFSNTLYIKVCNGKHYLNTFMVSHIPVESMSKLYNIHGHLHSPENLNEYFNNSDYDIAVRCKEVGRHHDCGLDRNNFKPISLEDIYLGKTDIKIN